MWGSGSQEAALGWGAGEPESPGSKRILPGGRGWEWTKEGRLPALPPALPQGTGSALSPPRPGGGPGSQAEAGVPQMHTPSTYKGVRKPWEEWWT